MPGKTTELIQLLKTGNSDAARKLIAKMKKSGKKKQIAKDLVIPDEAAHGQTVMHYCAAQNFVEFIHDLGDMGAPIDNLDDRGFTPMHLASASGRTSAVEALLTRGADPNVASHNGDTPLHLACSGGHASTVEALVVEHANATGFNVSGHTPLDLAAQHGHANAVSVLLRCGQFSQAYLQRSDIPHTALLLAAKSGHNEVIGLLVKHGFDVNRKLPGANGNSFHEAALYGKVETVKYLLLVGADVQAVNHQGLTALDVVNMYTDPRSAELMKQVLQDAMAQKARARIAQQAPASQQQQQQYQRQTSQDTHYQQPNSRPQSRQAQQSGYPAQHPQQQAGQHQSGYPAQHPQQQAGQHQSGYPAQQPHAQQAGQPAAGRQPQVGGVKPGQSPTPGFSYIMPGMIKSKSRSDSEPVERANAVHQQQQPAYSQQRPASGTPQTGYAQQQQPMKQRTQSVQSQMSHEQQRQQQYGQQHVYAHPSQPGHPQQQQHPGYSQQQAAYSQQHQQAQPGHPQQQQHPGYSQQQAAYSQQQQPGQQAAYNQQHVGYAQQQAQPGQYNQQHLQRLQPQQAVVAPEPPPGDGPMDLASQIKAKLATRKPMSSSPTQKEPPQGDDPYKQRSSTVSSTSSMNEIRQAVLKRRGSLTDRSSASPDRGEPYDRSNPPTLPRRGHVGPPTFTPLPPPEQEDPMKLVTTLEKPKRKPQPKPPPAEPEMDNELLKKLMRRQDRIQKAAETGEDPLAPDSTEELPKPAASKPPPPPERKTATLTSEPKEPTPPPPATKPPPTQPVEQPKEELSELPKPKSKPKVKAPPPKPKKEEPEVPPWQLELQKRKEKRAVEAIETPQAEDKGDDSQTPTSETQTVSETTAKELTPPPPEKRETTPPPPVKQKPAASPKKMVDTKPPIPPAVEPPTATPPPAPVSQPPPSTAPPPASQGLPPPAQGLPPPQSLPMSNQTLTTMSSSGQPGTPSSEMSRSTSLSSLPTTASASPLQITEPVVVSDWLVGYKLTDYINTFTAAGYDTTDFLMGITTDELTEIGVQKPGHKKKIMTALSTVHHKEHLLLEKPASVTAWLGILGMTEYESILIDAGYDDIDFISDITWEELQEIGITKKGHLKRFMRGIAELVEVSKSAPPTPSPIPRANGHGPFQNQDSIPPNISNAEDPIPPHIEESKTPEPQDDEKTIIAPPMGFDEPPKPNSHILPPVASKPKRISQDESVILRQRTHSVEREGSVPRDGGINKMRQMLEQQMGTTRSTESLNSDSSDHKTSRSPSHSPRVARKPKAGPPPAPKRSSNTQLSMTASMQSLSSSTSSLNSTSDKRVSGDLSHLHEPRVPPKQRKPESTVDVRRVPVNEPDFAEPDLLPKSYSVEDITAALDDMVSDDELLNEKTPRARGNEGSKVINEPPPPKQAPVKVQSNADFELDALSKALQGFDSMEPENEEAEEADQLLADIDNMLADLNSELDFENLEDIGTDV